MTNTSGASDNAIADAIYIRAIDPRTGAPALLPWSPSSPPGSLWRFLRPLPADCSYQSVDPQRDRELR